MERISLWGALIIGSCALFAAGAAVLVWAWCSLRGII